MGSHGVYDKVAIVGMGCTKFAELWDKGLDDLIVDASTEAFTSAGVAQAAALASMCQARSSDSVAGTLSQ